MVLSTSQKAQSSVEYLMTYGWALLGIIVMGLVMWQLGAFDISKEIQPTSYGFSGVEVLDFTGNPATGELKLVLINNAGTRVQLQNVYATIQHPSPGDCTTPFTTPTDLRPGEKVQVTVGGCSAITGFGSGEYYKANVSIAYQHYGSGLNHQSVGIISGPLE